MDRNEYDTLVLAIERVLLRYKAGEETGNALELARQIVSKFPLDSFVLTDSNNPTNATNERGAA